MAWSCGLSTRNDNIAGRGRVLIYIRPRGHVNCRENRCPKSVSRRETPLPRLKDDRLPLLVIADNQKYSPLSSAAMSATCSAHSSSRLAWYDGQKPRVRQENIRSGSSPQLMRTVSTGSRADATTDPYRTFSRQVQSSSFSMTILSMRYVPRPASSFPFEPRL